MGSNPLQHWYGPTRFVVGPTCVDTLEEGLSRAGITNALLVTSRSVAADSEIMDPVLRGFGDVDVTVFDEVSIEKQLDTVLNAVSIVQAGDVDGIVSLGGGSTVDAARAISAVAVTDADPTTLFAGVTDNGEIEFSNVRADALPVVAIPTTLSGAEVTCAAGMNVGDTAAGTREVRSAPMISAELWPEAIYYDPTLAARTPDSVLGPSAMNGLDHGIEMLYSRNGSAFTDATATQGVRLLNDAIPEILGDETDLVALERAMTGVALATTGLIDPTTGAKYSLIHAFGHQIAQQYDVHQGRAHGVVAPAVLDYVYGSVDTNRDQLAEALGCADAPDRRSAIVDRVAVLRDALGLPSSLGAFDALEREDLPELTDAILDDIGLQFGPPSLEPTADDIHSILANSW